MQQIASTFSFLAIPFQLANATLEGKGIIIDGRRNKAGFGQTLATSEVSLLRCGIECREHPECDSFNYHRKSNKCELKRFRDQAIAEKRDVDYWV